MLGLVTFHLLLLSSNGFTSPSRMMYGRTVPVVFVSPRLMVPYNTVPSYSAMSSQLFQQQEQSSNNKADGESKPPVWRQVLTTVGTAKKRVGDSKVVQAIVKAGKFIHNPITYLILAAWAGFKWDWCFRNIFYWFGVAFCIKWYRARYVFKIPVWDRQPNWNNIITSREQEKDLKAYTCKTCGSTLFIAKTREFFFEGGTGIGGLGCFSCGAKGKDNFVMDRDRIVEDVADVDDYFEYERPLDFVSRAERRKLLKKTGGDEEAANKLLVQQQTGVATEAETSESNPNGEGSQVSDEPVKQAATDALPEVAEDTEKTNGEQATAETFANAEMAERTADTDSTTADPVMEIKKPKKKKKKSAKKQEEPPPPSDTLDALGMDDF